ncbi:MAG TPA: hypothetical protein VN654_00175 [Vicinamibacterales bacterium]|nr:hypothetical protein [Vicinamibacterales bacterium]
MASAGSSTRSIRSSRRKTSAVRLFTYLVCCWLRGWLPRGYTRAVKTMVALAAAAAMAAPGPTVQPAAADKIKLALEVRTEGRRDRDENATRLFDELRRGLESSPDIELNPREPTPRIVWIVAGTAGPPFAASMMVTERYTRETLMVLGIEDDDIAERMMSLQIANDHQIFTAADPSALANRIVVALNEGVLAKLRAVKRKP